MNENELSKVIVDICYRIHTKLGPGLLESVYEAILFYELNAINIKVERQKPIPVIYKEIKLDCGYRIDLLVENRIVVELKVVEAFNPVHEAQILTYMKFAGKSIGLLINFNVTLLKNGLKRYKY